MPSLQQVNVNVALPFLGSITGTWTPDDASRRGAYHMFVEVSTRGALLPFGEDGLTRREFLESLHSMLLSARSVLHESGPAAMPGHAGKHLPELSFGSLTLQVISGGFVPMLNKWNRRLEEWEEKKPADQSRREWENKFDRRGEFDRDADAIRQTLLTYTDALAQAAGIPPLRQQLEALPPQSSRARHEFTSRSTPQIEM